jgi:hypothetical protein
MLGVLGGHYEGEDRDHPHGNYSHDDHDDRG